MFFFDFENPEAFSKENIRDALNLARNKQKDWESKIKHYSSRPKGELIPRMEKEEIKKTKEDLENIESDIAELEKKLAEMKHFQKGYFISNFKRLTALKKVKIGDIETEALLTPGYLSRLDKDGNLSDPNIEFVVTAADMLGVTVDELIRGDIAELTETEQFILSFLNQLIKDTRSDAISWQTEKSQEQFNVPEPDNWDIKLLPMYEVKKAGGLFTVVYNSLYAEKVSLSKTTKSCRAKLANENEEIFIMACRSLADTDHFEVYLKNPKKTVPLYNSMISCEAIQRKTLDLYSEIMKAETRIHLSQPALDMIKNYMNR